ncbi:SH3 domain-containing protein [Ancylobacter dichloromethanicus]|uniref:SH3 domain-containing protein n=1 Tax=Ancylobacter dichloromethanicus TaxID=518825 RepID=A0A9W6J5C5_9HYPH|nr:SH3 domain-containing protein [Ancylobacter dichloromethanicus]MBS7553934.1 SH3 domain-containing protein [Ancylobacter dichloromethanicus]GLK71042.1 hypothetical protein GCM10017643_11570 [Ancylobacter dichloromethanicus]
MPTSSQEPRGTGLSSSLVSDFRSILSTLEQEKSGGHPEEGAAHEGASPAAPSAAATQRSARPAGASSPRSLGDVRSRIAALGDMGDVLTGRAAGSNPSSRTAPTGGPTADAAQAARRRSFGSSARPAGETDARRKRSASKDVITWQRLGLLAVFMVVVGGGAVMLQSLAAREEAKVAPEVIGNAAVASVAPSAQLPDARNVASARTVELAGSAIEIAVPTAAASSVLANSPPSGSLPPILLNASGRSDAAANPISVAPEATAFAAPEPAATALVPAVATDDMTEPAVAASDAGAEPVAATSVTLPKEPPLPPVRAVEREVAATAPAVPVEAAAEAVDEGVLPAGFGGEPIGTAVTRRPVTMRAAPKKGATAIGNLPGGQKVELVTCQQWCEIIVEGKRAFVYKSFVDTSGVASAAAAAEATDEEATVTE